MLIFVGNVRWSKSIPPNDSDRPRFAITYWHDVSRHACTRRGTHHRLKGDRSLSDLRGWVRSEHGLLHRPCHDVVCHPRDVLSPHQDSHHHQQARSAHRAVKPRLILEPVHRVALAGEFITLLVRVRDGANRLLERATFVAVERSRGRVCDDRIVCSVIRRVRRVERLYAPLSTLSSVQRTLSTYRPLARLRDDTALAACTAGNSSLEHVDLRRRAAHEGPVRVFGTRVALACDPSISWAGLKSHEETYQSTCTDSGAGRGGSSVSRSEWTGRRSRSRPAVQSGRGVSGSEVCQCHKHRMCMATSSS
jgi:hypothetical protein